MALSATLRLLCLWLPLVVTVAVARPNNAAAQVTLDISSTILLGRPIFGEIYGPYSAGQDLTLICSTKDPSVTLTWWEGEEELQALQETSLEMVTSSLDLETLSVSDSGRKLTCKAAGTDAVKTIALAVQANLDVLANGRLLHQDDTTVTIQAGANLELNCILQDYSPSPLSWLEGDQELQSLSEVSSYATASVLVIPVVRDDHSGRRFTCRSADMVQEKVLQILVYREEYIEDNTINNDFKMDVDHSLTTQLIGLSIICVAGMVLLFASGLIIAKIYWKVRIINKLSNITGDATKNTVLSTSNITGDATKNTVLSTSNITGDATKNTVLSTSTITGDATKNTVLSTSNITEGVTQDSPRAALIVDQETLFV